MYLAILTFPLRPNPLQIPGGETNAGGGDCAMSRGIDVYIAGNIVYVSGTVNGKAHTWTIQVTTHGAQK